TYCSRKVTEGLGYDPKDVVGKSPLEFLPVEDVEVFAARMKDLGERSEAFSGIETTVMARMGYKVVLETNGVPQFDASGALIGFRGITRDISDRKKSELLQSQLDGERMIVDEMREMERMKAELIETVTHELRTPMTPLRSAVEMLLDGTLGEINDRQREILNMMERNIQRLARFATDVLTLSRLDAGSYKVNAVEVDVAEMLGPVVELLRHKARHQGDELHLEVAGGLAAFADPDAVGQVVTNLVDNAISHNPDGIRIDVKAARIDGGYIEIAVKDNGKGIPKESLRNLWDRFFQVDRQAGPGYRGTGLGLNVCKTFVEKMGGAITVNSVPDQGTSFRFTLPISETSADSLFGRIALEKGFVTEDQLEKAVENWGKSSSRAKHIGAIMVEGGFITARERDEILQTQNREASSPKDEKGDNHVSRPRLGTLALRAGDISKAQFAECLKAQRRLREIGDQVELGQIMVRMGYIDSQRVEELLAMQGFRVLSCPSCGACYNLAMDNDDMRPSECPKCGAALSGRQIAQNEQGVPDAI
ncbi:MAG: PAS domain S-box protein, partial [Deltaproteobacteria bacterium]|nr:PAS domain S-box protein [Deltaproteobacteria bacterium]